MSPLADSLPLAFRLIVAGGRDYQPTEADRCQLDQIAIAYSRVTVVSGCAKGADTGGEEWAQSRGLRVARYPADWATHGKAAGMIRNREMAEHADGLAVFPGGRGTMNMIKCAQECSLTIWYCGPVGSSEKNA